MSTGLPTGWSRTPGGFAQPPKPPPPNQNDELAGALPPTYVVLQQAAEGICELPAHHAEALASALAEQGWRLEPDHPAERTSPADALTQWWVQQARDEAARTIPKAVEYGANDLLEIGRQLAQAGRMTQWLDGSAESNEILAELGVYFYLVGKMARWTSAVQEGRRISDDTLFDIRVYTGMARRIRAVGAWPGVNLHTRLVQATNEAGTSVLCTPPDPPGLQVLYLDTDGYWVLGDDDGPVDGARVGTHLGVYGTGGYDGWYRIWPIDNDIPDDLDLPESPTPPPGYRLLGRDPEHADGWPPDYWILEGCGRKPSRYRAQYRPEREEWGQLQFLSGWRDNTEETNGDR